MSEVYLVNMPYGAIERPSIALGILKACLINAGIDVRVIYANLRFAETTGLDVYQAVSSRGDCADLLGEWTFSGAAFPDFNPDHSTYLNKMLAGTFTEQSYRQILPDQDLKEILREIREKSKRFINDLARGILMKQPRVVGCSSVFQQHCASLALLRRIRELDDSVITLLGGANCEGTMGLVTHSAFPWVDYIVSGEADSFFADFIRLILKNGRNVAPEQLPYGVIGSGQGSFPESKDAPRVIQSNLDLIPVPDYTEYFFELEKLSFSSRISPGLLIETSRGCWWGQKHQCNFCGLNGTAIEYRKKSPERVKNEMQILSEQYGIRKFEAVDNILDFAQIKKIVPALAAVEPPYRIFYETQAILSRNQLAHLAEAGVRWIQPGIENMHDSLLKLIGKGNTVLENIQLLRWALELGIRVSWNFLFGIPGEDDRWYEEMSSWLPLIAHLEPPKNMVRIRYDRFSPYHKRPEQFGIHLSPKQAYEFIYPLSPGQIGELAYFFEDYEDTGRGNFKRVGLEKVKQWVIEWYELFWSTKPGNKAPVLYAFGDGDQMVVLDTRPGTADFLSMLEGLRCHILQLCEHPQTLKTLSETLESPDNPKISAEDIKDAVEKLVAKKFLLKLNGNFLSLTVREPKEQLLKLKDFPGGFCEVIPECLVKNKKIESVNKGDRK